jgi:hypothetical protein
VTDSVQTPHYTPARLLGLVALFRQAGYVGRRSNSTNVDAGYVYWQTADWLVARELAKSEWHQGGEYLRLTDRGVAIARGSFAAGGAAA